MEGDIATAVDAASVEAVYSASDIPGACPAAVQQNRQCLASLVALRSVDYNMSCNKVITQSRGNRKKTRRSRSTDT